jgi:hypothetical protein
VGRAGSCTVMPSTVTRAQRSVHRYYQVLDDRWVVRVGEGSGASPSLRSLTSLSKQEDMITRSTDESGMPKDMTPTEANHVTRRRGQRTGSVARGTLLRRLLSRLAGALLLAMLASLGVGVLYLHSLPDVGDAQQRVATILAAHHGVAIGPPPPVKVGQAVVAVENARFYSDHGVDTLSVLHGAWGYLSTGSTQVAGATISEQLAKVLYVHDATTLSGKLETVGVAITLNQRYSKATILDMYLNAIYYGDGQWGVVQASETYFGKAPDALDWAQASLLAGLPNAPSLLDPVCHMAAAKARQRHVLDRLVATSILTPAQAAAAAQEPLLILGSPAGTTGSVGC